MGLNLLVVEVAAGYGRISAQVGRIMAGSLAARQGRLTGERVRETLDTLLEAGLLAERADATGGDAEPAPVRLTVTPLGRIAVRHLLYPATVLAFRRACTCPGLTWFDLLLLFAAVPDCEPVLPVDDEELATLGDALRAEPSHLLALPRGGLAQVLNERAARLRHMIAAGIEEHAATARTSARGSPAASTSSPCASPAARRRRAPQPRPRTAPPNSWTCGWTRPHSPRPRPPEAPDETPCHRHPPRQHPLPGLCPGDHHWALANRRRRDLPLSTCVQAWDPASARACARAYAGPGFDGIAWGGLVPRPRDRALVFALVEAVRDEIGDLPLHCFGRGPPGLVADLSRVGVDSVDSSAYVKRAADGRLWSGPAADADPTPTERLHLALCNLAAASGRAPPLSAHRVAFETFGLAHGG